ncbi:hypothetical protein Pan44_46010 [Caulifigura coniformis]|uniref:Uncharacterized protein n=1 Tax=Caulifigura coniformis TaxID=2527983 RepID=A0A517SK91_9PLAN|nr:hypothetical protein Pan44_46010 [Caulifigura coniformis]
MSAKSLKVYGILTVIGVFQVAMVWKLLNFEPGTGPPCSTQFVRSCDRTIHRNDAADHTPRPCSICRLCQAAARSCTVDRVH